tara:strand:- start:255 stop:554 length:300 start_codon:yes stop_codon:yes gene_type:complete
MIDIFKKLKDRKILKENTLVDSMITKDWMGSPVEINGTLIVKKLENDHCLCQEYNEADGKSYKIRYVDITAIDGMEPNELAAVYGLGPKTQRFKRRKAE